MKVDLILDYVSCWKEVWDFSELTDCENWVAVA